MLVFFVFAVAYTVPLKAQVEADKFYSDSLSNILHLAKTPQEKMSALKRLANLYWQNPEEVFYLKKIIDVAEKVDSFGLVYAGMAGLCRYYYNVGQEDSLMHWRYQIDSISLIRSESPNELYVAGNLVCKNYLGAGNYELAMNEAIRQLNKAKTECQEYGMMRANQNLGLIYQAINQDSNAMEAFREGLVWLKKSGTNESFELQYLSEMIISSLRLNTPDESESILGRYSELFDKLNQEFEAKGLVFPVQWHHWLINSFYAELYINQGELDQARTYLHKAAVYADVSTDEEMKLYYYYVSSLYYQTVGENEQALVAINKALRVEKKLDLLKMKVDVLRASGKLKEALMVYNELLTMNEQINNDAFERQIQQLRVLNDLNDNEQQASKLKYKTEQLAVKQQQLIGALLVSVVLLILLYIVSLYYRHARRLKNELLSEKDSLVESEKQLRIAKEDAEQANRMKTAFISSISHEVRTPLNAIVGFSELLADGTCEEQDKAEFASMINSNSEVLMNLVNDVLDLSRLESGNTRFSFHPADLVDCCRKAIEGVEHLIAPGVNLVFTPSVQTYTLSTDAFRLQQLLMKLLANAAKFTKKGEISLSFDIDEKECQVILTVTDTGPGVPAEKQGKIFERFEKLDEFAQGTGLGLPICLKIAKEFHGSLSIDPSYTEGARFIFIHPAG